MKTPEEITRNRELITKKSDDLQRELERWAKVVGISGTLKITVAHWPHATQPITQRDFDRLRQVKWRPRDTQEEYNSFLEKFIQTGGIIMRASLEKEFYEALSRIKHWNWKLNKLQLPYRFKRVYTQNRKRDSGFGEDVVGVQIRKLA